MRRDTTEPSVSCADDITVECVDDIPPPNTSAVTAGDNCGSVTIAHVRDVSDGKTCPQTISRTYRVTDNCGNFVECTQKIIVKDTTPPEVTSGPGPITVQCNDDIPEPAIDAIKATDNCGGVSVVHKDDVSDGNICPEVITRTYRVYDECMNATDFTQLITIDDDTPPELTDCPSDVALECPDVLVFDQPKATDNCDPDPAVVVVEEDSLLGSEPWTFHALRKWVAVDYCGNTSEECEQTITYKCEVDQLCTHTQGFYGNYGGKFNGVWTYDLIKAALSGSPLVVGMSGRSLQIPYLSAHCVIVRLPAGTTPTVLPYTADCKLRDDCLSHPKPIPLDSNGKFENVLLGQTITLGLNMRLNPPLFLFPLSETFCTQPALPGRDGLYGTEDDVRDTDAPVGTYEIAPSVLAAISQLGLWPTVQGLFDLANRALGGANTAGATIPEINDAVDAINRGFDGCRFIVDCGGRRVAGVPDVQSGSAYDGSDLLEPAPKAPTKFELGQNYPNPFNPSTRITIAVPKATSWSLGVFNVAGQLVRRFDGSTGGAAFVDVTWDGRDAHGNPVATGVYLYRVRAGEFADTKKMIFLK
ncbi:MAG: FlgD immunoglobulin-like domain containing protein [bacterium]